MFDKPQLLRRLRQIWFRAAVVTPTMIVDSVKAFYQFITGKVPCLLVVSLTMLMCSVTTSVSASSPQYRLAKPRSGYSKSYRLSRPPVAKPRSVQEKAASKSPSRVASTKATSLIVASATWCQPCKRLYPIIEKLAASGYNAKVVYDYDGPGQVSAYPTLLFFRDGKLVDRLVGVQTEAEIKRRLTK